MSTKTPKRKPLVKPRRQRTSPAQRLLLDVQARQIQILEELTLMRQHGVRLVEHCERLMREKQALLRAQKAEDPTPDRLNMIEADVDTLQRYVGVLSKGMIRQASEAVWPPPKKPPAEVSPLTIQAG
jgi:hypothetical protein